MAFLGQVELPENFNPLMEHANRGKRSIGLDLGKPGAREVLYELAKTCDVFLTVPSVDATPVSLLEAMACGVPVVISNLESAMEWVTDGENGLVVRPAEQDELEEAILKLIGDPDARERFAAIGVEKVRDGADHVKHMQRMERLCEELVAGSRRGAGGAS